MFSYRDHLLPLERELQGALQIVKGVGPWKALLVASRAGISYPFFTGDLNFYRFQLVAFLLGLVVIGEVKAQRIINSNIRLLRELQTFRGFRHRDFLPVRGQRTRTNAGVRKRLRLGS